MSKLVVDLTPNYAKMRIMEVTNTQQNYLNAFGGLTAQIMQSSHPQQTEEKEEWQCQTCGEPLESRMENVGFRENPKYEVEYFCPNGCENY